MNTAGTSTLQQESIRSDGKNALKVICKHCNSVVLSVGVAQLASHEPYDMPFMYPKSSYDPEQPIQSEVLTQWWYVNEMFAFENVAFTHKYKNRKYLACADCEIGPIGIEDVSNSNLPRFLIARDRVKEC